MGAKLWTAEEDRILAKIHASTQRVEDCEGMIPGRTGAAMQARLKYLKLGRRAVARQPWTAEEDRALVSIWSSDGSIKSRLHLLPGRSWRGILVRAAALGLGPRPATMRATTYSWVTDEVDRVLSEIEGLTVTEIAARSSASYERIGQVLMDGHGMCYHVVGWHQPRRMHGGSLAPRWAIGAGEDAPKPEPKCRAQVAREWRARKKAATQGFDPFAVLVRQVVA